MNDLIFSIENYHALVSYRAGNGSVAFTSDNSVGGRLAPRPVLNHPHFRLWLV